MAGSSIRRVRSEINITPLVDVVLVLLIIFMVVTPYLQTGRPVRLAEARDPAVRPDREREVLVVIEQNGTLWVGTQQMESTRLKARLVEFFQRDPGAPVVVKADSRLSYGAVKAVLLDIRDAGYRDVGLLARRSGS